MYKHVRASAIPAVHVPMQSVHVIWKDGRAGIPSHAALSEGRAVVVQVMSMLPIDESTLRYGSADGCRTRHRHRVMQIPTWDLCTAYRHIEGGSTNSNTTGCLPFDVEGHIGHDGRGYWVDLHRLCLPRSSRCRSWRTLWTVLNEEGGHDTQWAIVDLATGAVERSDTIGRPTGACGSDNSTTLPHTSGLFRGADGHPWTAEGHWKPFLQQRLDTTGALGPISDWLSSCTLSQTDTSGSASGARHGLWPSRRWTSRQVL